MRDIALLIITFGSLPFILKRPHIGILMWFWVSLMNPHRLTWGATRELHIAMIIGVTTIISWLISKESKRIPLTPITLLLIAFGAWTSITTVFALLPQDAYEDGWVVFMKILLITFIALPIINSRERLQALIWVTAGSVAFFGVKGGIFFVLTGGAFRVWGPPDTYIADNNAIALALLMVLPLLRYLQLYTASRWIRWCLASAMVLCGLSVIASYSRGAFITAAVMIMALILKSRKRAMMVVILAAAVVGGLSVTPEKWFDRISTIETYDQDRSVQGRFDAWRFAFRLALDRPFLGGGFKVSRDAQLFATYVPGTEARSFHSIYFQVLGEHGFAGLTLYLMIGIAALRTGTHIVRLTRDRDDLLWARNLAAMVQVSLISFATGGVFLNKAYFDLYYGLLVVMVVTRILVEQETKARTTEAGMAGRGARDGTVAAPRTTHRFDHFKDQSNL